MLSHVALALALSQDAAVPAPPLTIDDVVERVSWSTPAPFARWAWDGEHVIVGAGDDAVWHDPATWAEVEPQEEPERDPSGPRVRARGGELELVPIEGDERVLHTSEGAVREAHLSPDGTLASFVEDGDLKVVPVKGGAARTLAGREGSVILEGLLDWVYQEEVYGRGDFQGHWWSDDSERIAFLELDQSEVRSFPITVFDVRGSLETERGVELELMDYPKAGDPNPTTRLGIADVDSGKVRFVDLSSFPEDLLVVRVGWAPTGDVEFIVQNRIQSTATLCLADPETGAVTELLREESDTWVERPLPPRWLDDGSFLWMTERTGYRHLEHRNADGSLRLPITEGAWQVRSLLDVDLEAGYAWFEGTRDGALGANVYRVALTGGEPLRLSPGRGMHSLSFSDDKSFAIDVVSDMAHPTRVQLVDAGTGKAVREIGAGEFFAERTPRLARQVAIEARDGYVLDATVMLPDRGVAGARPPIFLDTYSGPDAPSVRDRWRPSTWHQFLAERGVLVLQVNVRTASGRGHAHTSLCYRQLGVQELLDLEDAVAPGEKAAARDLLVAALAEGGYAPRETVIRVNGPNTPWGVADIVAAATAGADAVLLPKVEGAAAIEAAAAALDAAGGPPGLALWAMIETPRGVLAAGEIAAHPRL
ncbi:MAG: aldolase/citrate lyase family protein, partial [Planctomycetota bacterium]